MSIAEDFYSGGCCSNCGCYFKVSHGYPVLCHSCYKVQAREFGIDDEGFIKGSNLQRAIFPLLSKKDNNENIENV